ncbi:MULTISPECIES: TRAP transporter substrate-binding protein [unclassified Lentilitoribacter]|jgi:TRAP-type C4-dicarboxylate transport system substrate-binding protein|uniref:TRAP transporter substrate-binding protein n=1 Tax=unclassified Lentilitoribacter TaxID=2647570 RepID=UPI0013A6CFB2|nr:TRAP transporter substrate-binding protein [Lentilitoribacter sp. Alg239-R112]
MKIISNALIAGLATFAFVSSASAEKTMVVSSWLPPSHIMNEIVWPEFIKRIDAATEGRVKGKIEYGLASPPAQADLIEDGGADAAWIFHGYNPGRFVTSKLIEIPGLEGDSAAASAAHWRAHQQMLGKVNEHDGVVPVAMMVHAPGMLHLSKEVASLEDVAGLKVRSGGGVMGDVLKGLDMAGVQVSAPKVYETVANGVADGTFFPGDTIAILRLTEVLPYTYRVPGGFYRGSFSIIMSEEFMDSIGEEDAKAINAVLGEEFSAFAGKAWDEGNQRGIDAQSKTGKVIDLEGSAAAKFEALVPQIQKSVLEEVSAKGVDADAALKLIRDTMAEYNK